MQRPSIAEFYGPKGTMAETPMLKSPKPQASASGHTAGGQTPAAACVSAMLSHLGRVRHANEDACAALPELGAFVVCDGMGGAAAGEVASQLAADAFLDALTRRKPRVTRPALRASGRPKAASGPQTAASGSKTKEPTASGDQTAGSSTEIARTRLCEAVRVANEAVFRHARRSHGLRGMGTTLVAALWDYSDAGTLWLAHVGDSRGYRLRGGRLERLTEDHSLVEEQVRAGTLSRVEAEASPIRNIITRAVGSEPVVEPEIAAHNTQPGDVYLLATDGLMRELEDGEIARILTQCFTRKNSATSLDRGGLEFACEALVDAANAQGGRDNITVLLIGCV